MSEENELVLDYDALLENINQYYDGNEPDKFTQVGDAATTLCDVNQIANQIGGMAVVYNQDGEPIGYDYKVTAPNESNTDAMQVDSNADSGQYGSAQGGGGSTVGGGAGRGRHGVNAFTTVGTINPNEQSDVKMYAGGVTSNDPVKLVSSNVSPVWAAVSAFGKLGINVGQELYNTSADFFNGLKNFNSEAFKKISTFAENGADAIRALFGIDDNGNTTMYLDEDTIGYMALYGQDKSIFNIPNEQEIITRPTDAPDEWFIPYPIDIYGLNTTITAYDRNSGNQTFNACLIGHGTWYYNGFGNVPAQTINCNVYAGYVNGWSWERFKFSILNDGSHTYVLFACDGLSGSAATNDQQLIIYVGNVVDNRGNVSLWCKKVTNSPTSFAYFTYDSKTVLCATRDPNPGNGVNMTDYIITPNTVTTTIDGGTYKYFAWYMLYGNAWQTSGGIPGITPQSGATIPVDAITGADPHAVAENLVTDYPSLMGSPVQIVVMDDSCNQITHNYYSTPISYSPTTIINNYPTSGGGTQINPTFNPSLTFGDIDFSRYIEQIIQQLGGSGSGDTVESTPDGTVVTDTPTPPNTGSGVTPESELPDTQPTAMWHVYNPSTSELSSLGAWLWSQNVVDQILRIMSSPIDAIIGCHAIYGEPHVSSSAAIVCGNLTSTVSARVVTSQYTSVDCGSVWLTEYFGDVMDYAPYTDVSLFLPFIGIVKLDVADVMRSNISVVYNIDVFSGACIAMVNVERDGVGGVLYQYGGDCAVEYPVTSQTYTNMLSSAVTVATSLTTLAITKSPESLAPAVGAAVNAAKSTVSRSGSFGANAGAMGAKTPYLIISRPIPQPAFGFFNYGGYGENDTVSIGSCSGFIRCKDVKLNVGGAYKNEIDEINSLLRGGIFI